MEFLKHIPRLTTSRTEKKIFGKIKQTIFFNNNKAMEYCNQQTDGILDFKDSYANVSLKTNEKEFIKGTLEALAFKYEKKRLKVPKIIVIDFSSPNIAKPFHVGHLRSTIIGNFIGNINQYLGEHVIKINYLGDWGTQFGLLKVGMDIKGLNMCEIKKDPLNKLYECYVTANQIAESNPIILDDAKKHFSAMENKLIENDTWYAIKEATISNLARVYERLGIKFDSYEWESDYKLSKLSEVLQELEMKKVIETDSTGSKMVTIANKKIVLLKSDGSTLYLTRDMGAALKRYQKYKFNEMLYVVDNSQISHFHSLFHLLSEIDATLAKSCKHVKFGRIKGMSTRKGTTIFLEDILDEAKLRMHTKQAESPNTRPEAMNDSICDTLGTTAVIINDLKQRRERNYEFSWDKALQNEGDTGIKLQYLHCRLWSLEKNSGATLPNECDPSCFTEKESLELIYELAEFHQIIVRARDEMEASILLSFLFRLTRSTNKAIKLLRVKNTDPHLASQRLLLFHSVRKILKTSLEILGVKPLNQM